MFNDKYGLTQAVLQGRKTMTRRICKEFRTGRIIYANEVESVGCYSDENLVEFVLKDGGVKVSVPSYKVGEVVAVAQKYIDLKNCDAFYEAMYKADPYMPLECIKDEKGAYNKMFVKAEWMPHQIRITDIKVERLQDISEEDCLKEGIQEYFPYIDRDPSDKVRTFRYFKDGKIRHCISPASKCFAYLIDDVSGKGTWESNPWVFAYGFELIK